MENLTDNQIDDSIDFDFFFGEEECLEELQAFGSSGGKSRIAKKLVSLIPDHKTYLEPFAGGAAVFWKKEPVELSVLNDKNSEIAFAYQFLRDCTDEQVNKLRQMNWSPEKSTFFKLRDSNPPQDPVQRFYRFFYVQAYSYGLSSKTYGYFETKKDGILNRIPKLREGLKNTEIYNTSYEDILNKYNSENSFAYLDPPYPDEWAGPEGTKLFTKENTQELHDILKNFKGKFLLSINNLDWIKEMFSDFKLAKIKVPRSFRKGDPPKYELLISNYDLKNLSQDDEDDIVIMTEGVTSSSVTSGTSFDSGSLLPTSTGKKFKKITRKMDEELEEVKELFVVKRDGKWCVIHGHPQKQGSKTDKPEGSIIKCFPGTEEGKKQAEAMHKAIVISKIKRGEMIQETKGINELKGLINKFEPITIIHNFVSLVGSQVKTEEGHKPNDIDIHLRMGDNVKDYIERAINVRFDKMLDPKTAELIHIFSGDAEGSNDTFVPLYHLVLVPADRKVIEMSLNKIILLKPELPQKPAGSAYYDINKFIDSLK